ncbi:rhomboid family intramembrane serine protease [Planctomycetota bacterium]|nr:rhomboid family intramembrane serine protease [Planctomycetota bacterium]
MSYDTSYNRLGFPRATPAISRLILINAVVFILNMLLTGRLSDGAGGDSGAWFCVSWSLLWEGYGLGLCRLLTYQFTHSFSDPMHLVFNMIGLYFFGRIAEQRAGYWGTIKLYLFGGLLGAAGHIAMYALRGSPVPVVGASGSCFALFLYAVCVAPRTEVIFFFVRVQLIFLGFLFCGLAFYSLFVELMSNAKGSVSDSAHLGGALAGVLAFKFDWFRDQQQWGVKAGWFGSMRARFRHFVQQRNAAALASDQMEVDRILAKVHETGLPSLTGPERQVLERASQNKKPR